MWEIVHSMKINLAIKYMYYHYLKKYFTKSRKQLLPSKDYVVTSIKTHEILYFFVFFCNLPLMEDIKK